MDKYKCRLCFRSFINGRALGGHMRSHMLNHHLPPKPEREAASFPSSSSSSQERGPNLGHGPREKPKEEEESKNRKLQKQSYPDSFTGSSISETNTEEDLAVCLMMLSEDNWTKQTQKRQDDESFEENNEFEKINEFGSSQTRATYKCETCQKEFRSYQALGGHRASHKKASFAPLLCRRETEQENAGASMAEEKTHESVVCSRSFSSAQALVGHKRSLGVPAKYSTKVKNRWLDLNMPAPTEEDDEIQIELSALSDAEFSCPR